MPTLEKADLRSKQVKKNVVISFLVKGLSLLINLIFVPLTINYVNPERYGLWLTLSSIISWFNLLDIGFGNGLRNKFAEATANNDVERQRNLVQTTLVSLLSISSILFLIYIIFFRNLNWDEILGVSKNYRNELKVLMTLLIGLFSIQFVLQIYNPIQYALQKSGKVSLALLMGSLLGLIGILILKKNFEPSLTYLGLVVMGGNILSLMIFTSYYFFFERPDLFKQFQAPNFKQIGDIFSLGFKFFIINIAYVVQFQTSNFLISKYIAVEKVTEFNIAFKLFSTLSIVFGIIISPIWSSVTNAKINNDFKWIRNIVKRLVLLWLGSCVICILLVVISPTIYYYWVGNKVDISFKTTIGVAMIVCTNTFSSIFIHILNGLSKVKVQFILAIIVIFIFMPIAYLFAIKLQLGIFGLCLAIVITSINGLIVAPIQVYREINNK